MKYTSLAIAMLVGAFALGAPSPAMADKKSDKDKKKESASTSKVAKVLKGKLVKVKDGKVADHELTGKPEYYVLYYSASW